MTKKTDSPVVSECLKNSDSGKNTESVTLKPISLTEHKKLKIWAKAGDLLSLKAWLNDHPGRLVIEKPGQRIDVGHSLLKLALHSMFLKEDSFKFNPDLLECLIAHGALSELNKKGALKDSDSCILASAVLYDSEEAVDFLLNQGCDIEAFDRGWLTPLAAASQQRSLKSLRKLIERGAKLDTLNPNYSGRGRTALMISAEENHLEVAQELVKAGANIFVKDQGGDGNTALDIALECESLEVAQYLKAIHLALLEKEQLTRLITASCKTNQERLGSPSLEALSSSLEEAPIRKASKTNRI